jgi:hypothetical protein
MTNVNRSMVKAQLIRQEGQIRTVFRPVVLALALTPEQKQVVIRYTGRNIEQLQLSQDDLLIVTGSAAAL